MDDSYIKRRRVSDLAMLNGNGKYRFFIFVSSFKTITIGLNLRFLSLFSAVLLMLLMNFSGARRPSFAESSGTASDDEETAIKEEYDRPSFAFARCCVANKTSYNDCSVDLNVSIDSVAFHVANYVLNDTPPQGKFFETLSE